ELRDGQSFGIAGLLDNQETRSLAKVPVVSTVPILGNLFKSKSFQKSESELVFIVTAKITEPLNPDAIPNMKGIDGLKGTSPLGVEVPAPQKNSVVTGAPSPGSATSFVTGSAASAAPTNNSPTPAAPKIAPAGPVSSGDANGATGSGSKVGGPVPGSTSTTDRDGAQAGSGKSANNLPPANKDIAPVGKETRPNDGEPASKPSSSVTEPQNNSPASDNAAPQQKPADTRPPQKLVTQQAAEAMGWKITVPSSQTLTAQNEKEKKQ